MSLAAETITRCLHKAGEELCGDAVQIVRTADSLIVVLADGLGSGVKANILATLTSRIAAAMLRQGAGVDEVVDTLASTLPVCQVRQLAYSTFLILQVMLEQRTAYLVEYDCPATLIWRGGELLPVEKTARDVRGRQIWEARFPVQEEDVFILISDGVVHAGVGGVLNLGWQWQHVAAYLRKLLSRRASLPELVTTLIGACDNLYLGRPGDDVTVAGVRLGPVQPVSLLTGPPADPAADSSVVREFLRQPGKKVVCGGTTAQLVSRCADRPLLTSLQRPEAGVPPMAAIPGLDLVTEGVITLSRTLELIRAARQPGATAEPLRATEGGDAASQLAELLLWHCTSLRVWLGGAENPAHRELAGRLTPKSEVVESICQELRAAGKDVEMFHC